MSFILPGLFALCESQTESMPLQNEISQWHEAPGYCNPDQNHYHTPVELAYRDLANDLSLSVSEISESLSRSHVAALVDESRKRVNRTALTEFLEYGLHYVFPQQPNTMVNGIPTAHSHTFFKASFGEGLTYVWPDENGWDRELSISPLYKGVPEAVLKDEPLYKCLAAIDIIIVGKVREKIRAIKELKKEILL